MPDINPDFLFVWQSGAMVRILNLSGKLFNFIRFYPAFLKGLHTYTYKAIFQENWGFLHRMRHTNLMTGQKMQSPSIFLYRRRVNGGNVILLGWLSSAEGSYSGTVTTDDNCSLTESAVHPVDGEYLKSGVMLLAARGESKGSLFFVIAFIIFLIIGFISRSLNSSEAKGEKVNKRSLRLLTGPVRTQLQSL